MKREWRIDSLGEQTAAVEESGELVHVPRWLLPQGAQENDIVGIAITDAGGARTVVLQVAADATKAALDASRRQANAVPNQNDPGGPIKL